MALVKFGGGIVQMSGSIAGNTFARNRSGNYVRTRTKPVNPNTAAQAKIRAVIAFLTEYWANILSVENRAAWGVYGANVNMKNKLGETINLSGFNHFIRGNSPRVYFGFNILHEGPTDFTLPDKDPSLAIDVDAAPQKIGVSFNTAMAWNKEVGGCMFFYQGIPQNGQRNFFAGPWHAAGLFMGSALNGSASPRNVGPYYPVAEGQKCWVKVRIGRGDGRLSEPWLVSAIVHSEAPFEVPMLLGLNQAQAEGLLGIAQLTLGNVTTENSDTVPVDLIISSDPPAHTILTLNAPVDIVVSLGPE